MSRPFMEKSDRTNPNKAEDNDLTRLDDVSSGSDDIISGTATTESPEAGFDDAEDTAPTNGSQQYVLTSLEQTQTTDPQREDS